MHQGRLVWSRVHRPVPRAAAPRGWSTLGPWGTLVLVLVLLLLLLPLLEVGWVAAELLCSPLLLPLHEH